MPLRRFCSGCRQQVSERQMKYFGACCSCFESWPESIFGLRHSQFPRLYKGAEFPLLGNCSRQIGLTRPEHSAGLGTLRAQMCNSPFSASEVRTVVDFDPDLAGAPPHTLGGFLRAELVRADSDLRREVTQLWGQLFPPLKSRP